LIGLVFIILFGVILSSRAGSSAPEHAALPMGESLAHATRLETVNRTVDPFKADGALDMNGQDLVIQVRSEGPAEEPLPAPVALASSDGGAVGTDDRGTVAFGPVTVETPAGAERAEELRLALAEPAPDRGAAASPAASDPSRPVYVVRSGDTLISIARRFYGKDAPRLWRQIVDANRSTLRDPERLAVGQKLVIPNVPQPPKSDAPRTDPPSGDVPGGTPLREPARDTALAGGPATLSREDVNVALRGMTVPADSGRRDASQSDLAESPTHPLKSYTVRPGDTFSNIAAKLYGDGNKYGRLLALKNPGADPSRLKIGQRIVLLDGAGTTASDTAVAMR
jgi:nucleoid-associated protein YgaU